MDRGTWWAAVHGVAKSRTRLSDFTFTFHFHALEKAMAAHSNVLAWRIPGTGEPGGLQSMGSHKVGQDWSDLAAAAAAAGDIWDLCFVSEVGQSHRAKALSLWDLHQVQGVGVRIELTWMEWDGIELMTPSWYWGLGNDDDGWCLLGTYYVPCACETHMFYVYFLR